MKIFQSAEIKNGKLLIVAHQFQDKISTLPDGPALLICEWLNPNKSIREYQKEFGAKRDLLCRENGWDRKSMNDVIYEHVLTRILMEPEHRMHPGEYTISTKELSLLGWKMFIEGLRLWAWSQFETYL